MEPDIVVSALASQYDNSCVIGLTLPKEILLEGYENAWAEEEAWQAEYAARKAAEEAESSDDDDDDSSGSSFVGVDRDIYDTKARCGVCDGDGDVDCGTCGGDGWVG